MILILLLESIYLLALFKGLPPVLKHELFLVFAKLEKILGKYKKLCRYCEGEDS